MKLGLAAWGFRKTPLDAQLRTTRLLGLGLMELSVSGLPNDALRNDSPRDEIRKVKALFRQHGVELNCIAAGNDFTLPDARESLMQLRTLKRTIDVACDLGASFIRIFAGFSPAEEVEGSRWNLMIDCLGESIAYAEEHGVVLALETHGGVASRPEGVMHFHSVSSDPGALRKMLSILPDLKVNFDPANLFAVGIARPEEVYNSIKERVVYAHLKDFVPVPGSSCLRPAACGESAMDWRKLLAAMAAFDGPALIEYENAEDVEDGCRRSLAFLRYIFKELAA